MCVFSKEHSVPQNFHLSQEGDSTAFFKEGCFENWKINEQMNRLCFELRLPPGKSSGSVTGSWPCVVMWPSWALLSKNVPQAGAWVGVAKCRPSSFLFPFLCTLFCLCTLCCSPWWFFPVCPTPCRHLLRLSETLPLSVQCSCAHPGTILAIMSVGWHVAVGDVSVTQQHFAYVPLYPSQAQSVTVVDTLKWWLIECVKCSLKLFLKVVWLWSEWPFAKYLTLQMDFISNEVLKNFPPPFLSGRVAVIRLGIKRLRFWPGIHFLLIWQLNWTFEGLSFLRGKIKLFSDGPQCLLAAEASHSHHINFPLQTSHLGCDL